MSLDAYPLVSDWLRFDCDTLVVRTGKVDIGQRISTALAGIVHTELTLPLTAITVAPVRTGDSPDEGITSGSNSIEQSGRAIRLAAATLRAALIELAAARMGGDPSEWMVQDGALTGPGTNRPVPLPDLAAGIDLDIPVDSEAALRATADTTVPMLGMSELVTGRYQFVHDLDLPGMMHARVVRPPHLRARLEGISDKIADRLTSEGLNIHRDGSFLAVSGPGEWAVVRGAHRLANACTWDLNDGIPEDDIFASLTQDNATRYVVEDSTPVAKGIPDRLPDPTYTARYERPFTMHGALAPSAALATWDGTQLSITTHSQGIYPLRQSIAESLDLALENVILTHGPGSGCYGHNGADDAAFEAALIAMARPDTPVLLKWSRDDEHAWEPFSPASAVEIAAISGADGRITSYSAEAIGGTFRGRPRPGPNRAGPAKLIANWLRENPIPAQTPEPNRNRHGGLHRNLDPIYAIPDRRLVKNLVQDVPHRTSALRCLGATANVFALESSIDDIARTQKIHPIAFRKAHLTDTRAIAVLDRLGSAMADRPAPGEMGGRGIAYAQYKNAMTRVGICVDIEISEQADVRLKHAIIVADAGRVIDADGLAAQLEGGFLQGASWALYEAVTWNRDGITSRDWESYPVLRFDNVPTIDVIVMDGGDYKAVGAGEASPGPTVAAIANAIFDATGLRQRRMPFTAEAITAAALQD
jgi:CO/xanthine dehydrogenase Mo-binding subunit